MLWPWFGTETSGLQPVLVHKGCIDTLVIRTQWKIRVMLWPSGLTLFSLSHQQEPYWFQREWDCNTFSFWSALCRQMGGTACGDAECSLLIYRCLFLWESVLLLARQLYVSVFYVWMQCLSGTSLAALCALSVCLGDAEFELRCDACQCIRRQVWDTGECSPSLLILSGCSHTVEFGILIT